MKYFLRLSILFGLLVAYLPAFAWVQICVEDCWPHHFNYNGFAPNAFNKLVADYGLNIVEEEKLTMTPAKQAAIQKEVPPGTKSYKWLDKKVRDWVFVPLVGPEDPEGNRKELQPGDLADAKEFCTALISAGLYEGQKNAPSSVVYLTVNTIKRIIAVGFKESPDAKTQYYFCPNPWRWVGDAK